MNRQTERQSAQTAPRINKTEKHQEIPLPLILDILKRQIAISTGFLALLQAEKEALINMDMNALIHLTKRKELELKKIAQLDHSLQEVAGKIVTTENGQNRIIKLAELIPFMTREQTLTMKNFRDQLAALREKITRNNLVNKHFASDTLGYINDAISLICGKIAEVPLYGTRGGKGKASSAPALVSREV
ncbi:MAG: flagellar protein FlgN [Desulfobulbaceae bacterium]|nr:flagellar protein FlgN [Desulfobulbaceae bacterium]